MAIGEYCLWPRDRSGSVAEISFRRGRNFEYWMGKKMDDGSKEMKDLLDKYKKALEHYARQTEHEKYPCPGSHTYYSSMHPNADRSCPLCGENEDGLGRDLYRIIPAKSGDVARKALDVK